jgi:hypothetical protein
MKWRAGESAIPPVSASSSLVDNAATAPPPASPPPANDIPASPDQSPVTDEGGFAPVITEGLVQLSGGITAIKSGDTVTVEFDEPMLRTRRPAKFEDILRRSLADVYGPRLDSILSAMPRGSIVQVEDLFADLPQRGLHIALGGGRTVALWPRVRMRDDGPLVVAYHAVITH